MTSAATVVVWGFFDGLERSSKDNYFVSPFLPPVSVMLLQRTAVTD